jgi:N-methylhydantoinase A
MGAKLAADIGGTFTDVVLETTQRRFTTKVLTTPAPEAGVMDGIRRVLAEAKCTPAEVSIFIHGTTLATNALIERKGARTAFVTTQGMRDILEMGYEKRFEQYDVYMERPAPLVPRPLRYTVPERIDGRGRVLLPLDESAVRSAGERLRAERVQAVAIGFMHAYAWPSHEQRAAAILSEMLPRDVTICLSSEVCPEIREYERFSTTCANAYVRPLMQGYLLRLRSRARCVRAALFAASDDVGRRADDAGECGPLPGPAGRVGPCRRRDSFVVDRTRRRSSARDVVRHGRHDGEDLPDRRRRAGARAGVRGCARLPRRQGKRPASAHPGDRDDRDRRGRRIDRARRRDVAHHGGPDSAGADPGPACYGRGGSDPTVTDADLALGRIDPEAFAGGTLQLDTAAAQKALAARIGKPLHLEAPWHAAGVSEIVEENMTNAARVHAIERGKVISRYAIIAFGGGAPLHAGRLAEKLGVAKVVVPVGASVGSAIGFLRAPVSFEVVRSLRVALSRFDPAQVNALLDASATRAREVVRQAVAQGALTIRRSVDARYVGQGFDLTLALPEGDLEAADAQRLRAQFERLYQTVYGVTMPDQDVELVTWSVTASSPTDAPAPHQQVTRRAAPAAPSRRRVYEPALGSLADLPSTGATISRPATSLAAPHWSKKRRPRP